MTINNKSSCESRVLSVVVIGLNEESQLASALHSVFASCPTNWSLEAIYVDSGSTDRSVEIASDIPELSLIHLNSLRPSAAKARNAGIKRVHGEYVQLLDGDSVLQSGWMTAAVEYLNEHRDVDCVFGHCIEMHPERSIYMRVCGLDWHVSPGEYRLSGGNAMWRRSVFSRVGLFDEELRLGEEPDLCYRVRQSGGRIFCIDVPMVKHDLEIKTFKQYWQRSINSGVAYVRVAMRYWRNSEKLWLYEMLRNFFEPLMWVLVFLVGTILGDVLTGLAAFVGWCILRGLRTALKIRHRASSWYESLLYGFHVQLIRLPIVIGQIQALLFVK